jgi:methyltransferase (TIGR00027 family)
MMLSPIGTTSRLVAAARALESESPQPLIHDPYARALAGEEGFAIARAVATSHIQSQRDGYLAIRTRFIDDLVLNSVAGRGIRQVVLLAAGMDTRAFRFDWSPDLQWFEVDRAEIFAQKEPVLAAMAATARGCRRTTVIADLEHDWVAPLAAAGFDAARPTLFVIEGLLVYLEPASVEQLMKTVFQTAAPGSGFVADVMNPEMLSSPYTQTVIARFREMGCPWRFATSEPRAYFERFGWRVTINTPDEPAVAHGRWPYPPVPQSVQGIPRIYFVSGWRL